MTKHPICILALFLFGFPGDDRGPKWVPVEAASSQMLGPDGKLFDVRIFRPPSDFALVDDVKVRFRGKEINGHILHPLGRDGHIVYSYAFVVDKQTQKDLFIEKAELLTPKRPKVDADCHRDCECPKCPQDVKDGKRPCTGCDECDGEIVFEEEYAGNFARYRKCHTK